MNDPEVASAPQETQEPTWPHQQEGDVTHADLGQHFKDHPEQYGSAIKPLIEKFLNDNTPEQADEGRKARVDQLARERFAEFSAQYKENLKPESFIWIVISNSEKEDALKPWDLVDVTRSLFALEDEKTSELKVRLYLDLELTGLDSDLTDDDVSLRAEMDEKLPLNATEQQALKDSILQKLTAETLDWDVSSPMHARNIVEGLTHKYELGPDVFQAWCKKAAGDLLFQAGSRDSSMMTDEATSEGFNQLVTDQTARKEVAQDTYLSLVKYGLGEGAEKLQEVFPSELQGVDREAIKQAAEMGLQNWSADSGSGFDDLRKIYKLADVPENYFEDPAHYTSLARHLGESIYSFNDVKNVKEIMATMHLPGAVHSIIDGSALEFDPQSMATAAFVGQLENQDLQQNFPKIYSRTLLALGQTLSADLDVADYFVERLNSFANDQPWLGTYLLAAVGHYSVAQKFATAATNAAWAHKPWAEEALQKAQVTVLEHPVGQTWDDEYDEYDDGYQPIKNVDPYGKDVDRFTAEHAKVASALTKLLAGKPTETALKNLGISSADEAKAWIGTINTALGWYNAKILTEMKKIGMEKELGVYEEGKAKHAFAVNLRGLFARYVAQRIDYSKAVSPQIESLPQAELMDVLEEGMQAYLQVLRVDVPLYDKLYEEFDDIRANGRKPMEVYLGRDGVYAWIGRKAQDAARRRKSVHEGWQRSEILEIHPKYLVYPRYFRDNMSPESQAEYLAQEHILQDEDPLFYDTGFTGTIPEQIMQVMGFDADEIEERIRLLSANVPHRRVRGIDANARREIIENIEYNSKLEHAAEGMVRDAETGRIRPIAQPTSPREQFKFLMIQQAISRHYWYKERHGGRSADIKLPQTVPAAV